MINLCGSLVAAWELQLTLSIISSQDSLSDRLPVTGQALLPVCVPGHRVLTESMSRSWGWQGLAPLRLISFPPS